MYVQLIIVVLVRNILFHSHSFTFCRTLTVLVGKVFILQKITYVYDGIQFSTCVDNAPFVFSRSVETGQDV